MMKQIFFFISFILFFLACTHKEVPLEYPVIDLVGSVEKHQRVYCSDLFSSIDLVPLETKEKCLVVYTPFPKIILKDSVIFISGNTLYAFNVSGKFLNQIGTKGQGPQEYLHSTRFFINTDTPTIYMEDLRKIVEYDFSRNYIRTIQTPEINDTKLIKSHNSVSN